MKRPGRQSRSGLTTAVLWSLAVALPGCSANRTSGPGAPEGLREAGPIERPASGEISCAEAFSAWVSPTGPAESRFSATVGRKRTTVRMVPRDVTPRDTGPYSTFTIDWLTGADPLPTTERTLSVTVEGSLVMSRVVDRTHQVSTVFDPPILVMPGAVRAGEPAIAESKITVYELDNPKRVKERGTARVEIAYVHDLELPADREGDASMIVRVIRSTMSTRFSTAQSERITDRWITGAEAPGAGLVRESYTETITVFGVPIETSAAVLDRAAPGLPGPGTPMLDRQSAEDSSAEQLLRDAARSSPSRGKH